MDETLLILKIAQLLVLIAGFTIMIIALAKLKNSTKELAKTSETINELVKATSELEVASLQLSSVVKNRNKDSSGHYIINEEKQ